MFRSRGVRFWAQQGVLIGLFLAIASLPAEGQSFAYVANRSDNTVSVINLATNTVVATVPVGSLARGVAVTPDGRRAYVANGGTETGGNTVSVVDTTTNTVVATIGVTGTPTQLPAPFGIAFTPDGKRAYVTCGTFGADLRVIDTNPLSASFNSVIATIDVAPQTADLAIAITPDGTRAYVGSQGGIVSVIDTYPASPSFNTVIATIPVGNFNGGLAITPDGARAYVTNGFSDSVSVIDTDPSSPSFNTVIATITGAGRFPEGVAITPDGARAYVAASSTESVSVIDTASNTVLTFIPAIFRRAVQVAFDSLGARAYVVNDAVGTVSVIDTASNTVVDTINVGAFPFGIAITPSSPPQGIQKLMNDVLALNIKQGISNSLDAKLEAALQALDDINQNNNVAAINALQAFINSVEAQRGVHISDPDATALIAAAQQIITLLGGP